MEEHLIRINELKDVCIITRIGREFDGQETFFVKGKDKEEALRKLFKFL